MDAAYDAGTTPLHAAARNGHTAVVAALLAANAAVDAADQRGNTPLHAAARNDHTAMVAALLNAGAAVDATDQRGDTPLHDAARFGHTAVVAAVLNAGAAVHATDQYGSSPLHHAVRNGRTEVVAAQLAAGADVDVKDDDDRTALDLMVSFVLDSAISLEAVKGIITVLLGWGARARASSNVRLFKVKRTLLQRLLDDAHRMSEQEREAAKAEWLATVARLIPQAVAPSLRVVWEANFYDVVVEALLARILPGRSLGRT